MKSTTVFLFFTVVLGCLQEAASDDASSASVTIVDALQNNLTDSQIDTYFIRIASLDPFLANFVANLATLPATQFVCLFQNLQGFLAAFDESDSRLDLLNNILNTCDPNQEGLYIVLEPLSDSAVVTRLGNIALNYFKTWPATAKTVAQMIVKFYTAKTYTAPTEKDIKKLVTAINKFLKKAADTKKFVKLFPSASQTVFSNGTYYKNLTVIVDNLVYILGIKSTNTATYVSINNAVAALWVYLHNNLMDYVSYNFNWILKTKASKTITGNKTTTEMISASASMVSTTLGMVWTSLPTIVDEVFASPPTFPQLSNATTVINGTNTVKC